MYQGKSKEIRVITTAIRTAASRKEVIIKVEETEDVVAIQMQSSTEDFSNQTAYIKDLLISESMANCQIMNTPIIKSTIELHKENANEGDLASYQRRNTKFNHMSGGTRPDISFSIRHLAQHNADPQGGHHSTQNRVFRYLKGTEE